MSVRLLYNDFWYGERWLFILRQSFTALQRVKYSETCRRVSFIV